MSRALAVLAIAALVFVPAPPPPARRPATPVASAFDFVKFPTPACAGVGPAPVALLHAQRLRLRRGPDRRRAGDRRGDRRALARRDRAGDRAGVRRRRPVAVRHRARGRLAGRPGHRDDARRRRGRRRRGHVLPQPARRRAGDDRRSRAPASRCRLRGEVFQLHSVATDTQRTGVAAQFRLRVVDANGEPTAAPFGPFTAAEDGTVDETLPASATSGAGARPRHELARDRADRAARRRLRGRRPARQRLLGRARRRARRLRRDRRRPRRARARELLRVLQGLGQARRDLPVHRPRPQLHGRAVRRRAASPSACRTGPRSLQPTGTPARSPSTFRARPGRRRQASSRPGPTRSQQDPQIVWKDLSSTATLTYDGGDATDAQPRPEGDPAQRRLRDRALRRPPVPGRARRLQRPPPRRRLERRPPGEQDQRPGRPRARRSTSTRRCPTGSCSRTAPCRRTASPPRAGTTSRASPSRRTASSPTPAAA